MGRRGRSILLLAAFLIAALAPSQPIQVHLPFTITVEPAIDAFRIETARTGRHRLEIDDSPGFSTPVVSTVFQGRSIKVDPRTAALIPGIRYWVRVDRSAAAELQLPAQPVIAQRGLDCETLQATWQQSGRFLAGVAYSQLEWDDHARRWMPRLPAVPIGETLYTAELVLRPALSAARACHQLQTMDEIALYYTAMLDKTQTLATFLKMPNLTEESRARMEGSNPNARTFSARFGTDRIGEGELYNSQWLHPAALLIRLISQLPKQERTPGMDAFLSRFTPFLVQDQLLRFLFDQPMPALAGRAHRGRVAHWDLALRGLQGQKHWETAMSDIDLWLLSSAAEVLGAHANDPDRDQGLHR